MKAFAIDFDGTTLPGFACFLDVAAALLPVSEETSQWFWSFVICVGVDRRERRKVVSKHAYELLTALSASTASLEFEVELASRFPNYQPSVILAEWITCLKGIVEFTKEGEICLWHGREAITHSHLLP